MQCLQFTYADTGQQICGGSGYLYLTRALRDRLGYWKPLPFASTDRYGNLACSFGGRSVCLDLYALYAAEIGLDGPSRTVWLQDPAFRFFLQRAGEQNTDDYGAFVDASDQIRIQGIRYFLDHYEDREFSPSVRVLPGQGTVAAFHRFTGRIPLMITRERLPSEGNLDLPEMAAQWGFVSGYWGKADAPCPHYVAYEPDLL